MYCLLSSAWFIDLKFLQNIFILKLFPYIIFLKSLIFSFSVLFDLHNTTDSTRDQWPLNIIIVVAGALNSELNSDAVNPLRSPYKTLGKVNWWYIFSSSNKQKIKLM